MTQLFRRRSDAVARLVLLSFAGFLVMAGIVAEVLKWSSYATADEVPLEQPVPFSHEHHVSGLGLDCRVCHTTVESSASAGFPPTHTCMSCHSQIWTQAKVLEPVRESDRTGKPIEWNKVNRLPDYVYFDHSIHVRKGIGCTSCHEGIGRMPLTWKARNFYMRDCLGCHRDPELHVRPVEQVFNPNYEAPPEAEQRRLGRELMQRYGIPTPDRHGNSTLTDCSRCHR